MWRDILRVYLRRFIDYINYQYEWWVSYILIRYGESIKIIDIARKLIQINVKRKTKNNPDGDIKIEFTGLKKGEKLFEELFRGEIEKTSNKSIFKVSDEVFDEELVKNTLNDLKYFAKKLDYKNIEIVLRNIAANKL